MLRGGGGGLGAEKRGGKGEEVNCGVVLTLLQKPHKALILWPYKP